MGRLDTRRGRRQEPSFERVVVIPIDKLLDQLEVFALQELWRDDEAEASVSGTLWFGDGVWNAQARTDDELP